MLTLQSRTRTVAADGTPEDAWVDVTTLRGEVKTVNGRERWADERTMQTYDVSVRIRYRTGVAESQRLVYGPRVLEIGTIIDPTERMRELVLLCKEIKNSG